MVTFVLTLTGPDRIGIVDDLTGLLLENGGNVETSRMTRLGGEFAVLMLVKMPADRYAGLEQGLEELKSRGYAISTAPVERAHAEVPPGWMSYRVQVDGADHEGIIHEVAHYLSERGINIESVDSESAPAPTSGVPLFSMSAVVSVPPHLSGSGWEARLQEIGAQRNLDIRVSGAIQR